MEEVGDTPKLSKTVKRRLRRERRANLPPVASEPKLDGPRLTKTAKRKLRMRKKFLQLSESEGCTSFRRPAQVPSHLDLENNVKFTKADKKYQDESSMLVECKIKLPEEEEEQKPKNMRKTDYIECHSSFKPNHIRWDLEPESNANSIEIDVGNYSANDNPTLEENKDMLGLLDRKVKEKVKNISKSDSDEGHTTFRPRRVQWHLEPNNHLKPPAIDRDSEGKNDGDLTLAECTDKLPEGKVKPNSKKIRKTVSNKSVNIGDNDAVLLPSDIDQSATIVSCKSDSNLRNEENTLEKTDGKTLKKRSTRYVLFVGNIPYTLTKEKIIEHFEKTDYPPKDVRLVKQDNDNNLNKGFAYVEFASEDGYLNALKLHHSILAGRRINVEYSTATKGKKAKSKTFIKKKNLKLKALVGKYRIKHS